MPRRLLLLITDLEIGGTPTVVRELAIRLREPGRVEIEVACLSKWGPVADQLRDAGIAVAAFDARGPRDLVRVVRKLIRLIKARPIDTVFSFLIHANTVAAIASRFVGDVRFIQSIQTTQPHPRWHWWLQALIQERAERVVVPSSSTAECAQRWALVPSEKLDVIANCITGFQPVRERPFGTTTQVKVGFLGRLDPVKRVSDVVAAVALLNERFRLDIFGEGRDRTRIESEIARLKVRARVTLYGSVAKPQAAIEPLDVLVLPSEAEGFGLVLIEAMAAGVPVVATNAPGIRDVVQHEVNGLLVPIGDVPALRAAIECVVTDKALRSRFINNGLNTVREKYSWDVVLPQYRALLHLD